MASIGHGRVISQLSARMRFMRTSKGFNLLLVLALALLIRLPFIPTKRESIRRYQDLSELGRTHLSARADNDLRHA